MAGKRNDDAAVKRGRKVFNVTREEKKENGERKTMKGLNLPWQGRGTTNLQ